MKPSPAAAAAAAAKEPEPGQAAVAVAAPREPDARWREKGEAEAERQRTRERLEATLAGLGELDYLRQRQELLVKSLLLSHRPGAAPSAAGPRGEPPGEGDAQRSLEEKFLEENILLLRRQLNCLRRRDAGLLSQLQELDKQISDLRLDVEKTTDERLETDSRPSSGFYELSDGASGSLSNSSNSVFSECLSSCHSSTCFCSPLETSLNSSDGRPKSTDLIDWMDYNKEGQHEDLAAGAGCRSLSTPHSNSLDVVADVHPKYQCDLVSKNGNDVYRYPSPLHAVAVQSPMFLLPVTGNPPREEERRGCNVNDVCIGAEPDSVKAGNSLLPQSSWSGACPSANKKIDGYILSLVQKKTHSVRTNKPRTNLNADPTKGILRHGSMCVRQAAAVSPTNVVNLKNSKQACLPTGGTAALDTSTFSPLNQRSKEANGEQLESRKMSTTGAYPPSTVNELQSKHPSRNGKSASQEPTWGPVATAGDVLKEKGQLFAASPKESSGRQTTLQLENKVPPPPKKILLRNTLQAAQPTVLPHEERPTLDFKSEGSSSQSLDEGGLLVSAQYIPAQHQSLKLHKSTRSVKVLKSSTLKHRSHLASLLETSAPTGREKTKSAGKKCRFRDDVDTNKKLKKPSGRGKRSSSSQLEPSQPSRQPGLHKSGIRSHGHGREVVVAKPKHKRGDYRRWKSSAEVSYEEALRRARRNRREAVSVYPQVPSPYVSPYAYIASDSEYSAECESLFHSTVVDTSEDERSNYTTNCFGDSESSLSEVEFVGESTTTSDSDESGGLIWSQFVQTLPIQTVAAPELQENAAKAFVKIKASHNLKKKILRFRSGSLKLMTTV